MLIIVDVSLQTIGYFKQIIQKIEKVCEFELTTLRKIVHINYNRIMLILTIKLEELKVPPIF